MKKSQFTTDEYEVFCRIISGASYQTYTFKQYLEGKPGGDFILLRHDVDYDIEDAIKIAAIESKYNIKSTYYIRVNRKTKIGHLQKLNGFGCEIGLHYDCLAKANGNYNKAIILFKNQLDYLLKVCEIKTVSAHGSSLSNFKNNDLFKTFKFEEFGLLGDASLSIDFSKIPYYNDTGRSWDITKNKIKDIPPLFPENYRNISTLDDLKKLIDKKYYDSIYISSHPELWSENCFQDIFLQLKYGKLRYLSKKQINKIVSVINRPKYSTHYPTS
jgi:cytochrome b involved in lipid metabolism